MKSIELRELSYKELEQELISLRKKQFNLRVRKSNNNLDKTDEISKTKKIIAKIKTFMSVKKGK